MDMPRFISTPTILSTFTGNMWFHGINPENTESSSTPITLKVGTGFNKDNDINQCKQQQFLQHKAGQMFYPHPKRKKKQRNKETGQMARGSMSVKSILSCFLNLSPTSFFLTFLTASVWSYPRPDRGLDSRSIALRWNVIQLDIIS